MMKFFDEFDFEESVHWIIMSMAIIIICFALYGKYKAGEFNSNENNSLVEDSVMVQKDSL